MADMPAASCSCTDVSGNLKSVRITRDVTPALKVRISIRFAGPHFETRNSQDHAATSPRSIKVAALTHRNLLIPSLIPVHSIQKLGDSQRATHGADARRKSR